MRELTELAVLEPAWTEYQAAVAEILTWNDEGNQTAMLASLTGNGRACNSKRFSSRIRQKNYSILI